MPGLGTSLGRGGATSYPQDLLRSDCVLIMGSNMAEAHPIAFANVVRAKEQGATVIHIDPHYSRTSALANLYVPIRAGSDLVFLGAIIRHLLTTGQYFQEYVQLFTNASMLVSKEFHDTEELDGLFSGFDEQTRTYRDTRSWDYQRDAYGKPLQDPTLQDPRCVLRILERHFARYTPEMVADVCGVPVEQWQTIVQQLVENSGRERTTALCYAVGWTQQSKGVQIIRAATIMQLLLGNIGRPGGGILALRGHASIQGSTDVPTLYDLLAGYMPQPAALNTHLSTDEMPGNQSVAPQQTLAEYCAAYGQRDGWWSHLPDYMVSLLKAWYGVRATAENDWGYSWLPKVIADHSHLTTTYQMLDGKVKGYFLFGQNPAAGSTNARIQRKALTQLDWLVVRDLYEVESAAFWYHGSEEVDPASIKTEVFLLPAAASTEKEGSFTNTQRLIQWRDKAVDPSGDARSDLWFIYHLGKRLQRLYANDQQPYNQGLLSLTWDYEREHPEEGSRILDEPDVHLVLKEMNGYRGKNLRESEHVPNFSVLKRDGSTGCGSWIYSGVFPDPGTNRAAQRDPQTQPPFLTWGFAWPANRRVLYNRASADAEGKPWSERKKLIWWDAETSQWCGDDVPDFPLTKAPDYQPAPESTGMAAISGTDAFMMKPDGKAWLYAPSGLKDGPLPTHYEAIESPVRNALYRQQQNPAAKYQRRRQNNKLVPTGSDQYPIIITTYRLTEHHVSGPMTRWLPWLNALQPALFAELSPELAAEKKIQPGGWLVITTPRGAIEARALVTRRMRPLQIKGQMVHQIGLPFHWGFQGKSKGSITNDLAHMVLEPNVSIEEAKAFLCTIRPGRLQEGEIR